MVKVTQAANLDSGYLESAMVKLRGLSPESQAAIASLVYRLAMVLPKAYRYEKNSKEKKKGGNEKHEKQKTVIK